MLDVPAPSQLLVKTASTIRPSNASCPGNSSVVLDLCQQRSRRPYLFAPTIKLVERRSKQVGLSQHFIAHGIYLYIYIYIFDTRYSYQHSNLLNEIMYITQSISALFKFFNIPILVQKHRGKKDCSLYQLLVPHSLRHNWSKRVRLTTRSPVKLLELYMASAISTRKVAQMAKSV